MWSPFGTARMADPERGRMLYENHCTECHQSVVYLREGRKVGSPEELRRFVRRFGGTLALGWGSDEVADLAR